MRPDDQGPLLGQLFRLPPLIPTPYLLPLPPRPCPFRQLRFIPLPPPLPPLFSRLPPLSPASLWPSVLGCRTPGFTARPGGHIRPGTRSTRTMSRTPRWASCASATSTPTNPLLTDSDAKPHGASQPVAAMQSLGYLTNSSGRVATFEVKLAGARTDEYTYKYKSEGREVHAHKFDVWLVGRDPQHYCAGYVKGTANTCQEAKKKYTDGTSWALSKVTFDHYTSSNFISSPLPYRVDLAKSTLRKLDGQHGAGKPEEPVPPHTVAEVSCITTNRSTYLIAVIKGVVENTRKSKKDEDIADVELVDNSLTETKFMATITVSVFGTEKIRQLTEAVGTPMAFFNLSVTCKAPGTRPTIVHYDRELLVTAPRSAKTLLLREKQKELTDATNTESLTACWTPTSAATDVSGPQPLSCAAFMDFTAECATAPLPEVSQLMWVHIEEPAPGAEVTDSKGTRIWYHTTVRDISGSVVMGIPERCALQLAQCDSMAAFMNNHSTGGLNMPLLCHARVSRKIRDMDGASQSVQFVNHTLETVEATNWERNSAPNAASNDVLTILNNCPQHDEGIHFAFLADIRPDPVYGIRIVYGDSEGPRGIYVAALVAVTQRSTTDRISDDGYKVVTTNVKDIANGGENNYTLVGYCSMGNLSGFILDPPRNRTSRNALVLFRKADEEEGLHIQALEYIEPDQLESAIRCMKKLRTLYT